MSEPDESRMIHGREIKLPNGAIVWGALDGASAVWRFTSKTGGVTHLSLSREAMWALIQIYQGIVGCDPDFAAVEVEPCSR